MVFGYLFFKSYNPLECTICFNLPAVTCLHGWQRMLQHDIVGIEHLETGDHLLLPLHRVPQKLKPFSYMHKVCVDQTHSLFQLRIRRLKRGAVTLLYGKGVRMKVRGPPNGV